MQIRLTRAVKVLLIACFASFVVQQTVDQFFGGNLLGWFALIPSTFIFEHRFWQILTYSFLHGDVMHLFLNMMMLLFIGAEIEGLWGTWKFVRFYFICALMGGIAYLLLQLATAGQGLHTPMVGASGAIYGLLMAYGLLFGERTLLFMMLFPMKAKHFIWILAGIEFMSTVFSSRAGVAGIAHLGGMAAGVVYLWGDRRFPGFKLPKVSFGGGGGGFGGKSRKTRKADHLKLVVNRDSDVKKGSKSSGGDDEPKIWH